jgi:hypothetical protein
VLEDVEELALLPREVLHERTAALVAEACAWSVGLSDAPHLVRRHGRPVATGVSLGARAEADQRLSGEEDARAELGDPRPGSFSDALGALTVDGQVHADRLEAQVLAPFVLDTCVRAAERARRERPEAWAELLDELGEDGDDLNAVVRAAEWDAPLLTDAEQLVLAALGDVPLVEVETEGLPLSLVRAAEAVTRDAAPEPVQPSEADDDLAGALFLAEVAVREAGLVVPVPAEQADALLEALAAEGLEPVEVLRVLPHLGVQQETADAVAVLAEALRALDES